MVTVRMCQVKRAGPRPPASDSEVPAAPGGSEPESHKQQPFGKGPRLYIGGVADAISEDRIRLHFAKWGNIADVYFPGKTGQRRVNYCFVTFDDWATAQQACNQSDRNIDGLVRVCHHLWYLCCRSPDPSQLLCLQPLDCITVAGTRQQHIPASLGSCASPRLLSGSHAAQHVTAALPEPLASLPAYASWLQQQSDHFQAASAAQAALMPTPLAQPVGTEVPSVQHSHLSLAEQQHIFMQGLHAGMQHNSLSTADVQLPCSGACSSSTTNSWTTFHPGLSPSASPARLHLPPQYLNSDSQVCELLAVTELLLSSFDTSSLRFPTSKSMASVWLQLPAFSHPPCYATYAVDEPSALTGLIPS